MTTTIGTCSCCGGRVSVPAVFFSVVPPVPTCESCGATKRDHGPVVDMAPRRQVTYEDERRRAYWRRS